MVEKVDFGFDIVEVGVVEIDSDGDCCFGGGMVDCGGVYICFIMVCVVGVIFCLILIVLGMVLFKGYE